MYSYVTVTYTTMTIGKVNSSFQRKLRRKHANTRKREKKENHSLVSTFISGNMDHHQSTEFKRLLDGIVTYTS